MNKQNGFTLAEATVVIVWLIVVVGGGTGWVLNIVHIVHSDFGHLTGLLVLRVVGVFIPPLGAVLGYF